MRVKAVVVALAAAAVPAGALTVAVAAEDAPPVRYDGTAGATIGLRPTGVGLPDLGGHGTVGVGEYIGAAIAYHDSGAYDRDVTAVVAEAREYLEQRLADHLAPPTLTCRVRYRRTSRKLRGAPLFRQRRICRQKLPRRIGGKPAIVLDIDETSLSNYTALLASGFTAPGVAAGAVSGASPALAPTLELYRFARERDVAVFFITGRPDVIRGPTESNLRAAGYTEWDGLSFRPSGIETAPYKAGERGRIEAEGYDVLVNLGDQESDLAGGHADRRFKLPNPFYFISS